MENSTTSSLTSDLKFEISSARKIFLETLQKTTHGQLQIRFPEGTQMTVQGSKQGPSAFIHIKNEETFALILEKSDIGLGESYILGYWESPKIDELIHWAISNKHGLKEAIIGLWYKLLYYKMNHWFHNNSRKGAAKNIQAHYDLGNAFYKTWLDETMTYSSAYWGDQQDLTLQEAQNKKYQILLNHINAKPGDSILEIGCGWGGFAEFAANLGMKVTGITISKEQYTYANDRMIKNNVHNQVDIIYQDYRDLEGSFDHIVSIEMLEAVGEKYWSVYFDKIKKLVKPGGTVAIQTITINDKEFISYRKGTDFIQQYIFPGGMLPCEKVLLHQIKRIGGKNSEIIRFGLDYARTLKIWHDKLNDQYNQIEQMGFSNEFMRMWKFYLKYCEGAFYSGQTNVIQLSFTL